MERHLQKTLRRGMPTILPPEYSDDKLGVLDVAVLLKDGTQSGITIP